MKRRRWLLLMNVMFLSACASSQPIRTVEYVDVDRFMGDWYVIANIPTFIETGAHNAIESYALEDDGTIATTFTFNADGFDGERKQYTPRGFIRDRDSNAVWGMQFIWPIKAEYRIVYLAEDYSRTIIGRSKRDYVWLMARTPDIPEEEYQSMVSFLAEEGYDVTLIQKVPQRWE